LAVGLQRAGQQQVAQVDQAQQHRHLALLRRRAARREQQVARRLHAFGQPRLGADPGTQRLVVGVFAGAAGGIGQHQRAARAQQAGAGIQRRAQRQAAPQRLQQPARRPGPHQVGSHPHRLPAQHAGCGLAVGQAHREHQRQHRRERRRSGARPEAEQHHRDEGDRRDAGCGGPGIAAQCEHQRRRGQAEQAAGEHAAPAAFGPQRQVGQAGADRAGQRQRGGARAVRQLQQRLDQGDAQRDREAVDDVGRDAVEHRRIVPESAPAVGRDGAVDVQRRAGPAAAGCSGRTAASARA
jgi:hypothetical protein